VLPIAGEPDIRYTVVQSLVFVGWGVAALLLVARRPRMRVLATAPTAPGDRAARRRAR
jgi:hypothetical protein